MQWAETTAGGEEVGYSLQENIFKNTLSFIVQSFCIQRLYGMGNEGPLINIPAHSRDPELTARREQLKLRV